MGRAVDDGARVLGPRRARRALRRGRPAATSSRLDFYVAFGYWKLACILEGVYARYLGGALGARDRAELAPFARPGRRRRGKAAEHLESCASIERPTHRLRPDVPALDEPVLVVMLTGWIDASGAAAAAMAALEKECERPSLVAFDDDMYIDYRARRPMLELRDGVNTGSCGPSPELHVGRDADGRDVLLLSGPEPDMAWHRFAGTDRRPRRSSSA